MESYIHLYETNDKFTAAYNGPDYKEPWLSLTEENNAVNYNKPKLIDFSTEPLTFNIVSDGTINWTVLGSSAKTIEYKVNDNEWASITSNTESAKIPVNHGDKIQFRGNNAQYCDGTSSFNMFSGSTAEFEVEGNIMSLINSTDFATLTTLESGFTFTRLFNDCTGLTSAENLILPATTLADYCYGGMFLGCTSLTTAPSLPATTLADYCYSMMFQGCIKLTTAPALPVTKLVQYCYYNMFAGCSSLKTTPELPATILTEGCYSGMFNGCTSLITAPVLPATTLAMGCYSGMFNGCTSLTTAPELPVTTLADYCYSEMFQDCTSLKTAPELPARTLAERCYNSMFNGCTSLTTAPALPATTLAKRCYEYMFYGCTKLNYIKCLATDISVSYCTNNWVDRVASTGTFVKAASMSGWTTGISGIPSGWDIQDA